MPTLVTWGGPTRAAGVPGVSEKVQLGAGFLTTPATQRAPGTAIGDKRRPAVPALTRTRAICAHQPHFFSQHLAGAYSAVWNLETDSSGHAA